MHDVNPRVWGTAGALGEAGVDFFAAYIAWLRCARPPEQHSVATSPITWIDVYPSAARIGTTTRGAAVAGLWRQARRYGARYAVAEGVRQGQPIARRMRTRGTAR